MGSTRALTSARAAGLALAALLTHGGEGLRAEAGAPPPAPVGATTTMPDPAAPPLAPDPEVVRADADADEPLCALAVRPPAGLDAEADRAAAHALEPMMAAVNTYGVPLGQEFRGSGQSRDASGGRVVIASFVANVADHRSALSELVDQPDLLVVCRARLAVGEANAIVAEISPRVDGAGHASPGSLDGQVRVSLGAGHEPLAAQLHAAYGDRVTITLGAFPYPMSDPPPASVCPDLAPFSDILLTVAGDWPIVVETTDRMSTRVDVPFMNTSSQRVSFTTGYPWPLLVEPLTGEVVGVPDADMAVPSLGFGVELDPGEAIDSPDFSTWVPTATCDPSVGHTVPPGDYHLYATYSIVGDTVNIDVGEFAVGPFPVTVVAIGDGPLHIDSTLPADET